MRRQIIILAIVILTFGAIVNPAYADTLSDFRLGHFSLNLGYWAGTTDLAVKSNGQNGYLRSDGGNFDGDFSLGLSHGFAVRYGYTGLSNNYSAPGGTTVTGSMNTQDVMLLFKTGNGLGNTLLNAWALVNGQTPYWTAEPENGNNYSVFLGYSQFNDNTVYPPGMKRTIQYDSGWETGVINAWPINNKINTFGKASIFGVISGPGLFVAEAGFSYAVVDNTTVNLSYKTAVTFTGEPESNVNYLLRTGFRYGICFWY
ncbi:MAG: hypothetical protein WCV63_01320 [Negativicutes bacterium]